MEKKIFLDKDDDLNKAVDTLISSPAEKIILNIPKNSVLGLSVHNFQVLERESETAGKELAIESVDERILELASLATIPAVNPVFKTKEKAVADVLPAEPSDESVEEKEEEKPARKSGRKKAAKKTVSDEKNVPIRVGKGRKKKEAEAEAAPIEMMEDIVPRREPAPEPPEPEEPVEYVPSRQVEEKVEKRTRRGRWFWTKAFLTLVAIGVVGYLAAAFVLPRVSINVSIKKTSVPFSYAVAVNTATGGPSVSGNTVNLPGELSVAKKNLTMSFPATGRSTTSTKSRGTIIIHNDYSQNQTLIATTRFESPEGKIFRLVKQAVVPKGKTLEAEVVADKPGPDYNVPPSQTWQIPGFTGKPQYGKIYGETKTSMTGGAEGEQTIPSADDIKKGRAEIEEALLDALRSQTTILDSENLKLLDNASAFSTTTESINQSLDGEGNFSIFAAGELRRLVFDEDMLKTAVFSELATSTMRMKIDEFSLDYGTSTVELALGTMSFRVSGSLVYEPDLDLEAFKGEILGLDSASLKEKIFALPELEKANISFWPFWVNSVPNRLSKVSITAE